ncbi:uncharacterized protein LOC121810937 isoform X1 [Salvia splendens]|uniref:uncharacterized protein LOC121810937 isoform X1 n=1 Tax=Salvia splendens TaxID=180675 RepID=UPI001C27009B|nr:uncharacterized protein LOC121810937 isoform X1 [Salvia splendens]
MSSATRFIKLIGRFSSQYPASNTSYLRHHGLSPNSGNRCLSNHTRMQIYNTQKRKFSVDSGSVQPQPSAPLPPSSYLKWILGLVASIVVPSTSGTWGPFIQFKNEVDAVVETIEEIVEVVEKVAEIVDKVAEEISEDMPEGQKLKKVVDHLEDVAEATAQDARTVGDAIDKFQEVEGKIEGIMGINDEDN